MLLLTAAIAVLTPNQTLQLILLESLNYMFTSIAICRRVVRLMDDCVNI
jgi:hypothetical protein